MFLQAGSVLNRGGARERGQHLPRLLTHSWTLWWWDCHHDHDVMTMTMTIMMMMITMMMTMMTMMMTRIGRDIQIWPQVTATQISPSACQGGPTLLARSQTSLSQNHRHQNHLQNHHNHQNHQNRHNRNPCRLYSSLVEAWASFTIWRETRSNPALQDHDHDDDDDDHNDDDHNDGFHI